MVTTIIRMTARKVDPTIITRHGKEVAMIVSIEDGRALEREEASDLKAALEYEKKGPSKDILLWNDVKDKYLGKGNVSARYSQMADDSASQ